MGAKVYRNLHCSRLYTQEVLQIESFFIYMLKRCKIIPLNIESYRLFFMALLFCLEVVVVSDSTEVSSDKQRYFLNLLRIGLPSVALA